VIPAEPGVTELVARHRDGIARNDPMSHADVYSGLHGLAALLAALHMRHRTGRGQHVEVSMAESMLTANDLASAELSGNEPEVGFRAGQQWSSVFRLGDGRDVSITVDPAGDVGFAALTRAAGRTDLADDARFATREARAAHRDELRAELSPGLATYTSIPELQRALGRVALAAEVRTVPELAATDWATERGAFVGIPLDPGTTIVVPQAPWRFSDAEGGLRPTVGFRGEHNAEVLRELLGLDDAEVRRLYDDSVLSDRVPDWRRAQAE
jgi:crotonobetainyl-CoA:carnitine CoA-transferase CaiB-like acyl-CoA transferase